MAHDSYRSPLGHDGVKPGSLGIAYLQVRIVFLFLSFVRCLELHRIPHTPKLSEELLRILNVKQWEFIDV